MSGILTWTLAVACLLTGGIALTQGVRSFATKQLITQRLHEHISPSLTTTKLGKQSWALLEQLGRHVAGASSVRDLQDMLLKAGFSAPASVFVFAALRLIAALAAGGLTLVPAYLKDGSIESKEAVLAFFLGFFVYRGFSIYLKQRSETRQRELRRELPYVLDLLLMVLDSGVSVDQALQHVSLQIGHVAPITAGLLSRYIAETDDGTPYDKALDRLAQRLAISEGRDFAGLLKQNVFQGGELSEPLRRLAADVSETRLAHAREQMGRKSVLLTLVMLAFFMPVLLVALAAPAVSDVIGTLSSVAHQMENLRLKK